MNKGDDFKPYIPSDKIVPELTITSVVIGILLAVVFGAANAYLGLRVGITVSASIPTAVVSMGIIRIIMNRNSILESNMVQTIGSAGESLAAGAIFTLPALFMWSNENTDVNIPDFLTISTIAICGGVLGVLFMVPLRAALIVEEHGTLPFPEGMACSEVLLAGENGGEKAKKVFKGLGIASIYKFASDGLKLFPSRIDWEISAYKGAGFGLDVLPALLGVGYICGTQIAAYMFGGAILGWLVIMPLISLVGENNIIFPGTLPVGEMDSWTIWGSYVRYIGAGAVAMGGIISLIKTLPLIVNTFKQAIKKYGNKAGNKRTDMDLPIKYVAIGVAVVIFLMWLTPSIPINLISAIIIAIFGFFFATVSARMVGLVGSSNNPVSGMAIATLLLTTLILKSTGNEGVNGMVSAICVGTVICIIAAMAGDTSQDLKTGYIVGATPVKQQIGELIGSVFSGIAIGGVLYLLDFAWGFGTSELPAPQATLMKIVVEGVMGGDLPWGLILIGAFIAVAVELVGVHVLPFAIGLYLPIHLSAPIVVGGLVRTYREKNKTVNDGLLFSSGMIAGEGLVGIILAVLAVVGIENKIDITGYGISLGNVGAMIAFVLLVISMARGNNHEKKV